MATVLSLTTAQHFWLQGQVATSVDPNGVQIYAKLIKPTTPKQAKQSPALLDVASDSSVSPSEISGSNPVGSSGATLTEDGHLAAPEPEWDDTPSGAGSQVLQPGASGVDLELDSNSHADGFSGDTNPSPEFTD